MEGLGIEDFEKLFLNREERLKNVSQGDMSDDFLALQQTISGALETKPPVLQRLVSDECAEMQQNEMLALKCILEEDFSLVDEDSKCFKISLMDSQSLQDPDEQVDIWFSIPINYPNVIPIFELEGYGALSRENADNLYGLLTEAATNKLQSSMIYDMIMMAREFMEQNIAAVREKREKEKVSRNKDKNEDEAASEEEDDFVESYGNCYFSSSSGHLTPTRYTGPIHKILERIKDHQVYSIENIVRHDLAAKFEAMQRKFSHKYFQLSRKHPQQYSTDIRVAFHGTAKNNISSIVQTGLKVPGRESGVQVEHGSSYGVGIYVSPEASFSLTYSSDDSLLVCSVLLGHCLKLNRHECSDKLIHKIDSVMSHCGNEIVLFNAAQVLPCFIIRLGPKSGKQPAPMISGAYATSLLKKLRENETPEERQERLRKRAAKYLPYGYGPTSGKNRPFVVEDVADSSDDEEEYGDYQMMRYNDENFN